MTDLKSNQYSPVPFTFKMIAWRIILTIFIISLLAGPGTQWW